MNLVRLHRNLTADPFAALRNELASLFEAPLNGFPQTEFFNTWTPAVDLYEDKDSFVVQVEAPGLKKEDLDVSLHDGSLIISGERRGEKPNENADSYRTERFVGRFQRSVALPKPVDAAGVSATYRDGILTVTLPKTEEAKPRQIEIA